MDDNKIKSNAEFNIDLIHKIGQDDLVNSFTEEQQMLYDKQMFLYVSRWYCARGREDKAKQLLNDFFNPQLL